MRISHRRIEKLLIIADADGRDPSRLADDIKRKFVGRYPFPVVPLVIVQALEAWLLADARALQDCLRLKERVRAIPNPERLRDPKAELERLAARRLYTEKVAGEIAENMDLGLLAARCPTFSAFREAVLGD